MSVTYGIDVSTWQDLKQGDFNMMYDMGIMFCVVRASHGLFKDEKFDRYSGMAAHAGMEVGAYHFLIGDISGQAEKFYKVAKDRATFFVNDVEHSSCTNYDAASFLADFPGDRRKLGFYTNPSLLSRYGRSASLYDWRWIAEYRDAYSPTYIETLPDEENLASAVPPAPMWQFTDKMIIPSVSGVERLDANVYMGDFIDFLRYVGVWAS